MPRFYLNGSAQPNGDYEIHQEGCYWLDSVHKKKDLKIHKTVNAALERAKKYFDQVSACEYCITK